MLEKAVWMGVLAIGSLTVSGCVVERYLGGEGGESGEGGHATIGTGEGSGGCGEVGAVGGHAEGAGGHSEGGGSTGEGGFSEGGGSATGSGGQGGFEECVSCAEYITPPGGVDLCPPSAPIYDALAICVCEGACTSVCGDNACQAMESSEACTSCVIDEVAGCGMEYNECANDI